MSEPTSQPAPAHNEQQGVGREDSLYLSPRSGMSTPAHNLEDAGKAGEESSTKAVAAAAADAFGALHLHSKLQAQADVLAVEAVNPGIHDATADAQPAQAQSSSGTVAEVPDLNTPSKTPAPVDAAFGPASTSTSTSSASMRTLPPSSSVHASRTTSLVSITDGSPPGSPGSSSAEGSDSLPTLPVLQSIQAAEVDAATPLVSKSAAALPEAPGAAAGTATPKEEAGAVEAAAPALSAVPRHIKHVSALSFGSLASDSGLDSLGSPSSSGGASDSAAGEDRNSAADDSSASPFAAHSSIGGLESLDGDGGVGSSSLGGDGEAGSSGGGLGDTAAVTQEVQLDMRRLSTSSPVDTEAAAWEAWQAHKRHFFVVTSAGKPVFSRHGDETALAGFMAIIQAVVSVVADQGDTIRSMEAGRHQLVFLLRGHLYLVAVSAAGEPKVALVRQLEMLYHQILFIVTTSVERMLQRNPGYDVAQLLAGTNNIHKDLLRSFSRCPGYLLDAYEPAPMAAADRRVATEALQEAVRASGALYGLLVSGRRLVALDRARSPPLHPLDILLTINFVSASESFRVGESFSPVCLPHFKASAFLHAYIACLDPELGTFLLLLSGSSDAFFALSAARGAFETRLRDAGVVQRLRDLSMQPWGGRQRIEALPWPAGGPFGTTPLWHYCVRFPARKQLIISAFPEGFQQQSQQKAIIRAYARLHCGAYAAVHSSSAAGSSSGAGLHGKGLGSTSNATAGSGDRGGSSGGGGAPGSSSAAAAAAAAAAAYMLPGSAPRPARVLWVTGRHWVAVCCPDKEVELYVIMDPLTDKELGTKVCEQLRRHYGDKARQQELLLPSQ